MLVHNLPDNILNDNQNYINILSKSDLIKNKKDYNKLLAVSSKTHEGINTLLSEITKKAKLLIRTGTSNSLVIVERHRIELNKARKNLKNALSCVNIWSEEIISFELKEAQTHLEAVIGQNIDIDVLDEIFKNFCVGK